MHRDSVSAAVEREEGPLAALASPETPLSEIVRLLERDEAMARRIVRLANSAFFAGRTRILSVREAVVRMGTANVAAAMLEAA